MGEATLCGCVNRSIDSCAGWSNQPRKQFERSVDRARWDFRGWRVVAKRVGYFFQSNIKPADSLALILSLTDGYSRFLVDSNRATICVCVSVCVCMCRCCLSDPADWRWLFAKFPGKWFALRSWWDGKETFYFWPVWPKANHLPLVCSFSNGQIHRAFSDFHIFHVMMSFQNVAISSRRIRCETPNDDSFYCYLI